MLLAGGLQMKGNFASSTAIVALSLLLVSCSGREDGDRRVADVWALKRDSIKVGMTYDEVERVLGKPAAIGRGVNQLVFPDVERLSLADLALSNPRIKPHISAEEQELEILKAKRNILATHLALLQDTTSREQSRWLMPHVVETVGQLIYVNWVYSDAAADTNHVWVQKYVTEKETVFVASEYIVNGRVVTKEEFDKVGQYEYRTYDFQVLTKSWIISKEEWEEQRAIYGSDMPPPRLAKKEIRKSKRVVEKTVPGEIVKKLFIVRKLYCVLFDASSGRVVQSGFQPFAVDELK
jgi:hypothetical protein